MFQMATQRVLVSTGKNCRKKKPIGHSIVAENEVVWTHNAQNWRKHGETDYVRYKDGNPEEKDQELGHPTTIRTGPGWLDVNYYVEDRNRRWRIVHGSW